MSIERQELRETAQIDEGVLRYKRQVEQQGEANSNVGLDLCHRVMASVIPSITENVALLESGKTHPSQVPLAYQYLTEMDPDAVAYLTGRVAVSSAANRMKLTRTAMRLSNLIEENYRFEELEQNEPALCRSMSKKAERWRTSGARRRIMRKAAEVGGVARMNWSEQEKLKLGIKLIELAADAGNVVEVLEIREGKQTYKLIALTPEAEQWMADKHESKEEDKPIHQPMLVPPVPWTSPITGGYLTQMMRKNFVRGVGTETRDDVFSCEMPDVYDAVNRIQATPWKINTAVLDVLQTVYAMENSTLGGLPEADPLPIPERPEIIDRKCSPDDMPDDMKAAFNEWKGRAREVHEYNGKLASKRYALATKLHLAEQDRDEPEIYFPHTLDFRGRVYSCTSELSPQSDDVAKSLLQFANGKPLGETGGYWLAVQIANLFGVDKVSFDDRVEWVVNNTPALLDSAIQPLDGARFWTEADDPWCALAACFEWAGFQMVGDEYVSHIPIAMDGSCSGIQHFSAMLRDSVGGAAVNLTKQDSPADIYTEVLNETKDLLVENEDPLAKVWWSALSVKGVGRKIVKRPCMTFAYSVTSIGIRDQIAGEMRKQTDGQFLPGHENWQAAALLAPIVEQAIRRVVDRAAEAMDWLKKLSKHLTDEKVPTSWVTPLGFPVVQPYRKAKGKRMTVWFQGERMQLTLRVESRDIDGRKQSLSIAPNFVHSLDATHLMMVVNRMHDEGVTDCFAMIHDSFGVHACDVNALHLVIRDEFIKLYSEDVLVKTYQSTLLALPGDKWPDVELPPEAGDLNLEEVRDAEFFFA